MFPLAIVALYGVLLHDRKQLYERLLAHGGVVMDEITNYRYLKAFLAIIRVKDNDTGCHTTRIGKYCAVLARTMGLSEGYAKKLEVASYLHDIGKVAVPDHVLFKMGGYSKKERLIMQTHAQAGYDIIKDCDLFGDEETNKMMRDIVRHHHECWSGGGYPAGIAYDVIPKPARIARLADTFDALMHERVYKRANSFEETVDIIKSESGSKLEPAVVAAFNDTQDEFRSILNDSSEKS